MKTAVVYTIVRENATFSPADTERSSVIFWTREAFTQETVEVQVREDAVELCKMYDLVSTVIKFVEYNLDFDFYQYSIVGTTKDGEVLKFEVFAQFTYIK